MLELHDRNDEPIEITDAQWEFIDRAENYLEYDREVFAYSGRGMYGRECPAITSDYRIDEFEEDSSIHKDSMGLGTVYYMP